MGAIYGYLGSGEGDPLPAMAAQLAPCGGAPVSRSFPGGAFGYLPSRLDPAPGPGGLADWPEDEAGIAVAGAVNARSLREIYDRFAAGDLGDLRGSFAIAIRQALPPAPDPRWIRAENALPRQGRRTAVLCHRAEGDARAAGVPAPPAPGGGGAIPDVQLHPRGGHDVGRHLGSPRRTCRHAATGS
ncbi:MAG: hypothetical protein R3F11_05205 [Verrucomicrobiales bacterium]